MDETNLGEVTQHEMGWSSVPIWYGHLTELTAAMDPDVAFVVVEGHLALGINEWQPSALPLSRRSSQRQHTWMTRRVSFDLLMTPLELTGAAEELRSATDGGALLWQAGRRPPAAFFLDSKHGAALAAAMRGLDIRLIIDLPHDGETALMTGRTPDLLHEAIDRLLGGTPGAGFDGVSRK
ncbi:MAG: hypothetical protein ACRYF3_14865 [Janthinobacterium lividum]